MEEVTTGSRNFRCLYEVAHQRSKNERTVPHDGSVSLSVRCVLADSDGILCLIRTKKSYAAEKGMVRVLTACEPLFRLLAGPGMRMVTARIGVQPDQSRVWD